MKNETGGVATGLEPKMIVVVDDSSGHKKAKV